MSIYFPRVAHEFVACKTYVTINIAVSCSGHFSKATYHLLTYLVHCTQHLQDLSRGTTYYCYSGCVVFIGFFFWIKSLNHPLTSAADFHLKTACTLRTACDVWCPTNSPDICNRFPLKRLPPRKDAFQILWRWVMELCFHFLQDKLDLHHWIYLLILGVCPLK